MHYLFCILKNYLELYLEVIKIFLNNAELKYLQ